MEAALKLNNKINIKIEDLEKLVGELRSIEKDDNEAILSNLEIPVEDKIVEDQ